MEFLLGTFGSAGDVHPVLALGSVLQQRGHNVTLMTTPNFADVVADAGLPFIGVGDVEAYERVLNNPRMWDPQRGFEVAARDGFLPLLRPAYAALRQFDPRRTLLVCTSFIWAARLLQENEGYHLATIQLQPTQFFSARKPPVLGGNVIPGWLPRPFVRLFLNTLQARFIDPIVAPDLNAFRAELALPPVRRIFGEWQHSPELVVGLFPDWFAPPQADWPPNVRLTGFVTHDRSHDQASPDPALDAFLDAGPPPILFTAGTAMRHARDFFANSVAAARRLGRRALLLTQYPEQLPDPLPEGCATFRYVPFSQVLPRAALLVHHGGIGTAAQALAAGIPQLVMPHGHDQPDNAQRLVGLGVARALRPKQYSVERAVAALSVLLEDPALAARCRALAERIDFAANAGAAGDVLEDLALRAGLK